MTRPSRYCKGAIMRYESVKTARGSRALVVVDRKLQELAARFQAPNYRRAPRQAGYGAAMGQRAGARINIPTGRPVGTGPTAKRIRG